MCMYDNNVLKGKKSLQPNILLLATRTMIPTIKRNSSVIVIQDINYDEHLRQQYRWLLSELKINFQKSSQTNSILVFFS